MKTLSILGILALVSVACFLLYRFLRLIERRYPVDTYVCCGSAVLDGHPLCPLHSGYIVYSDEPQSENEFQDEVDL